MDYNYVVGFEVGTIVIEEKWEKIEKVLEERVVISKKWGAVS